MANSVTHAALPYPVKNARFTVQIPYLDADGDPTDPTTPDTEITIDGATFADCAEEATTITGSNGVAYITLTGAETNCSAFAIAAKVASGPKATLGTFYPRVLPIAFSGTASAGAAGTITLPSGCPAITDLLIGCIVRTTGGTGGGGTGGANNQARVITAYTSGRVATVVPNWETTPDSTTTVDVLLTEMSILRYADVKSWQGDMQSATDAKDLFDTGYDPATHKIQGVVLADTLTTYTGNTPQTGDSFVRIGAAGAGLTSIGDTRLSGINVTQIAGSELSATHLANAASVLAARNYYALRAQVQTNVSNTTSRFEVTTTEPASAILGKVLHFFGTGAGVSGEMSICTLVESSLISGNRIITVSPALSEVPATGAEFVVESVAPAIAGDAMTLTSGERDSVAAALLDLANGIETSVTVRQALKAMAAVLAGTASGGGTGTEVFKSIGGSTTRVTSTVESDGDRTAVTLNV